MKALVNAAAAAIVSLVLIPAAHAELRSGREQISARVSLAGLDLTRASGRERLHARIATAARRVCRSNSLGLREWADASRCRREMQADGDLRIAAMAERSRQLAAR